nr:hypothetical protein [uncultured Holophaga sp.]
MSAPEYTIRTIQDMSQIPLGRVDDFLADLRQAILCNSFASVVRPDLRASFVLDEFVWVDDGEHDLLEVYINGELVFRKEAQP